MTLPKGLFLYHTSSDPVFKINNEKPMLFLVFHPSEWHNDTIVKIKLNKPIQVLFMIDDIRKFLVYSLLSSITNKTTNRSNLNKQDDRNLKCYIPYLKAENLDGWFTSIENKSAVEVAIINNPTYYTVINSGKGEYQIDNFKLNVNFPIYTKDYPVIININKRYKRNIEKYMDSDHEYPFQIVLENAQITYFNAAIKPIFWKC